VIDSLSGMWRAATSSAKATARLSSVSAAARVAGDEHLTGAGAARERALDARWLRRW
jgi:hypothetical protein